MTSVGRDDAVRVFRGWLEGRDLLRVEMQFAWFAGSMEGRLIAATDLEVRVLADDRESEFVLRLLPRCTFSFADIQDLHDPAPHLHDMVLVSFDDKPADERDHVAFAVMRPPTH